MNDSTSSLYMVVYLIISVILIVALWKIYVKAGKPGWGAIVPIYNIILLLEITKKPLWWIILLFIPIVNLIVIILLNIALAEKFGKSALFGIGLILLGFIFYPILGFGDAKYKG